MTGFLSSFMLAGLLATSPGGFTHDGPEVTARTVGSVGFFTQGATPFTDLFERGQGSAQLVAQDRIGDPRATYGDAGRLEARFQIAGTEYRVELERVGFPPAQALSAAPVTGPLPPPPAQPISGGVVVNQDMHGATGLGVSHMPRVHAAAAMWGVGRVWRNGELLTDTALIHAAALSRGVHADDESFRLLASARPGDTELYVLVWNLPREAEPRGFIQFGFDDVLIDVAGFQVPAVAVVPPAGSFVGTEPPTTPVPGGASLGAVSNSSLSQQQQGVGGSGQAGTGQGQLATAQTGTGQLATGPAETFGTARGQVGAGQGQGQVGLGQGQGGAGQAQAQFGAGQSRFGAGQGQFGAGQSQFGAGQLPSDGLADPARTQAAAQADVTFPGPAREAARDVLTPFLGPPGTEDPGRVALSAQPPGQVDELVPGQPPTGPVPPAFLAPDDPGRIALSAGEPGVPGQPDSQIPGQQPTPFIPNAFQNPARMRVAAETPPASVGGFVPLAPAPQQSPFLSSNGSFSIVPLVPAVPGPEFAFGGPRVTAGVVRTPDTQTVETPAVPLVATPQPLNAQQPVPLVSGNQPLNAQPAVPLIAAPQPLNAQPIGGTPAGVSGITNNPTAGPIPGATTVPGQVPGATTGTTGGSSGTVGGPGVTPGTTTPGVSPPGVGTAPGVGAPVGGTTGGAPAP